MQFTSIIATALLSSLALAAPTKRSVKSMAAADNAQWTFESVTRQCSDTDTTCNWGFGINANDGNPATQCTFAVSGNPAYEAPETGVTCGAYTVTSNWSGQFGPGNGFTTFAVVSNGLIAYPSYTDSQLWSGQPVTPDQSFPVQSTAQ